MKKRILAWMLAVSMVVGISPVTGYAQINTLEENAGETAADTDIEELVMDTEEAAAGIDSGDTADLIYGTGLLPVREEELVIEGEPSCGVVENAGARAVSEWDKYSNHYYYNQMNEQERAFYDRLDSLAYTYLTSSGNILGAEENYSEPVSSIGLSVKQASNVFLLFRYANPQYYFLSSSSMYSYNQSTGTSYYWVFGIYPQFVNGAARARATAAYKASIENGVNAVLAAGVDPEKRAQAAHDWIINKVQYSEKYIEFEDRIQAATTESERESILNEQYQWELNQGYTQSAYSTFCTSQTVCAGYTQAFSLLCNAVGLEAIGITSKGHAWNQVRLFGNWYAVDCTWDDPVSENGKQYLFYDFFDRSEAYLQRADSSSYHVSEDCYAVYNRPKCNYDSAAAEGEAESEKRSKAGIISEEYKITVRAGTPRINASISGAQTTVTLSCPTAGTPVYYYTLDGSTPSVSKSRSIRAAGNTIQYTGSKTIKIIASAEGYLESNEASYTTILPSYTVSFYTGSGSAVSAQKITLGELVSAPPNPTRTGYTFEGWFRDSACQTAWVFSGDRVEGNTTLYAKWTPVSYKITYNLNKGKNSKSNPASYKITSKTITLKKPTRKGYIFKGWYSDSKFKIKVTKITAGSIGNQKLYAKWAKVTAPKKTKISKLQNKKGKKLAVTIKKVSGAEGYQVRYSTKSSMKSAKTVTVTKTSATISKLTKGKTYYVQVRAYKKDSTRAKVSGSWSSTKQITIRK